MRYLLPLLLLIQGTLSAEYHSQAHVQQDKFLNENYFHNKRGGVFVEFGAYDGVDISNSYFFEKELGWTGLCVEPMDEPFKKLQKNRSCICVQGCITAEPGTAEFLKVESNEGGKTTYTSMLSGILSKYDPRHLARVRAELGNWARQNRNLKWELIQVPCYKLTDLLDKYNMYHIDYLSIDTEGGELEVLKSIDYSKYQIDYLTVEDNYGDSGIRGFMESKGFECVAVVAHDLFFRNKNLR